MYKLLVSIVLLSFVTWLGCTNQPSSGKMINPNGDSELALLMRQMFEEGMVTKQQIIDGEIPDLKVSYQHIHTAQPTEEGKTSTTEYMLFAKAYEASVERLMAAAPDERVEAYQNMVNTCMNCHETVCPGPMVKIKKMYLSEDQLKLGSL
jgi:hypothetical protein